MESIYGSPIRNLAYTNLPLNSGNKPVGFLYMEMELAHKNLYPYYGKGEVLVPDSIVFEISLGHWATLAIAKLIIGDDKGRHHVLKDVDYLRAYHIGKHTYLFSHPELPKRIDLDVSHDAEGDLNISKMNTGLRILHDKKVSLSVEARAFLDELDNYETKHTTLDLLCKYFSKYIIPEEDLPKGQTIKHFHIPVEFIGQDSAHESAAVAGGARQAAESLD